MRATSPANFSTEYLILIPVQEFPDTIVECCIHYKRLFIISNINNQTPQQCAKADKQIPQVNHLEGKKNISQLYARQNHTPCDMHSFYAVHISNLFWKKNPD